MKRKNLLYLIAVAVFVVAVICVGTMISNKPATTSGSNATTQADGDFQPFFRIDGDDPDQWQGDLKNLRIFSKGTYSFKAADEKYGLDPNYKPDETGLDTLACSASGQFSIPQLKKLKETLEPLAQGKQITIVDLRQESHGFLDERSFSWYAENNWGNKGKILEDIEADEAERFGSLVGKEVHAHARDDINGENEISFTPQSYTSEKAAVEEAGLSYLRLPCTDHSWPAPELIDTFIAHVQYVGIDNFWPHFHCHAGKGRTGIFMMLYDKMKNPELDTNEIVMRQTMTGSNYPFYVDVEGYKKPLYEEIAHNLPLLFQYVDENRADGYMMAWSEWFADHEMVPESRAAA